MLLSLGFVFLIKHSIGYHGFPANEIYIIISTKDNLEGRSGFVTSTDILNCKAILFFHANNSTGSKKKIGFKRNCIVLAACVLTNTLLCSTIPKEVYFNKWIKFCFSTLVTTKCPPFCRRHLQAHFIGRKCLYFGVICFWWWFVSDGQNTRTNVDSEPWRNLESLIHTKLYIYTHYADVIMIGMASQITSLAIVYSIVYSDADQRNHQSSASLAFVPGIHRGPVNSSHKWQVTRKMFPSDDVIMMYSALGPRLALLSLHMRPLFLKWIKFTTTMDRLWHAIFYPFLNRSGSNVESHILWWM